MRPITRDLVASPGDFSGWTQSLSSERHLELPAHRERWNVIQADDGEREKSAGGCISSPAAHRSGAASLLDVACGTGKHLELFRSWYEVAGIDLNADLVAIARERLPDVRLEVADMTAFDLGRRFDVVTCLFSSIGYVGTVERLDQAIATMAAHLEPGGTPDRRAVDLSR